MYRSRIVLTGFLFLLSFAFASSVYAIPFTGDAWIAQHIEDGVATDEYYLVVNEPNITNVKVHGFSFLSSGVERDFSELTGQAGNEGISWLQVDNANSSAGLALSSFNLFFQADSGTWYQGVIGSATFNNPVNDDGGDGGNDVASVPEPTTLLLLGAGLLGLATVRKRIK